MSFLDILQAWFNKSIDQDFKHPGLVITIGIASVLLSFVLFKFTDQQLFPEMERNQFAVEVYLAGGRIRLGYKLARQGEDVNVYQKAMTRDEVRARTEELFWTLQSLNEIDNTIRSYQLLLDSLNRDVNNYTNAGLSQRNDGLKVQLKQNELKINLVKLKNGINLTGRVLCQQTGLAYVSALVFKAPPDLLEAQAVVQQVKDNLIDVQCQFRSKLAKYRLMTGS